MKRFAFVMDPLERLDLAWDTSLCLLRELYRRGHQNFLFDPSNLFSVSGRLKGKGSLIRPRGGHRYQKGPLKQWDLARFDAVLIRKDPPVDAAYLALTYLLDPLVSQTRVINSPRGLRNANEKLFGLSLNVPSPPTFISSDPHEILRFQKRLHSDVVVKPLYEKGGEGIFRLKRSTRGAFSRLKKTLREQGAPITVQKFIPLPSGRGDKRVLLWRGKSLGAFERIPKQGEFRSNLSLGGHFLPTSLNRKERDIVRALRPTLAKEGLDFVGLDLRGGFVIEINVTSPAGLVELDQLYGGATKKVADDLIRGIA